MNLEEIIKTFFSFNAKQIAAIVAILTSILYGIWLIEKRYAKLTETENNISSMQDNIIQIHSKITATINEFPEDRIKRIEEKAKKQEEVIKQLLHKKTS